jgi:hypothetical protein
MTLSLDPQLVAFALVAAVFGSGIEYSAGGG